MKYIITESQYNNILEHVSVFIKRRLDELDDMITQQEINYPTLCDDFNSAEDYADEIIRNVMSDFLENNMSNLINPEGAMNIYSLDKIMYDKHYDRLVKVYNDTCIEYNS